MGGQTSYKSAYLHMRWWAVSFSVWPNNNKNNLFYLYKVDCMSDSGEGGVAATLPSLSLHCTWM